MTWFLLAALWLVGVVGGYALAAYRHNIEAAAERAAIDERIKRAHDRGTREGFDAGLATGRAEGVADLELARRMLDTLREVPS